MKYEKYTIEGKNITSISNVLKNELEPSVEYASKRGNAYFSVFERYSFLQNSDMSGILLVDIENENRCVVNVVVAGGKAGAFRLDIFGRENSVLKDVKKVLQKIADENSWKLQ